MIEILSMSVALEKESSKGGGGVRDKRRRINILYNFVDM